MPLVYFQVPYTSDISLLGSSHPETWRRKNTTTKWHNNKRTKPKTVSHPIIPRPVCPNIHAAQQQSDAEPQRPGDMSQRRQQTTASYQPPGLAQNHSSVGSIARRETAHLESRPENVRSNTTRLDSRPDHARTDTANTGMTHMGSIRNTPTARKSRATRENVRQEPPRRPEKKQQQVVDVDNDYFSLNPWYNEQKSKPVFGLGAPLPRTVRKGMWWGRGDLRKSLYKVDDQDAEGVAQQDYAEGKGESSRTLLG